MILTIRVFIVASLLAGMAAMAQKPPDKLQFASKMGTAQEPLREELSSLLRS
jgi:hypothetical protein